jgi:hypothetical protein
MVIALVCRFAEPALRKITMKKANGKCGAPSSSKHLRRTPRVAEIELTHLEGIVRGVLRSSKPDLPIGPQYWRARFRQFEDGHALVPVQQARVEALRKLIAEIEALSAYSETHADRRVAA